MFNELARDPQNTETVLWNLGRIAEEGGDKALAARHYQRINSGSRAVAAQSRAFRLQRELGAPERAELQIDEFLATVPAVDAGCRRECRLVARRGRAGASRRSRCWIVRWR